jgi:FtsZ-interacting cell division protein YlmF
MSYDYDQKPSANPQKNMFNTDIFNPNTYEDAQRIAVEILAGNSAIVNLEHLLNDETRKHDAIRIIDFLCGVAYAIKIDVKRVNAATFLFTMK